MTQDTGVAPKTAWRAHVNPSRGIVDDPTTALRPLGVGSARCQCFGCGRHFTSVSAFDIHQRVAADGATVCRDPRTVTTEDGRPRLVLTTDAKGHAWWTQPGSWRGPSE